MNPFQIAVNGETIGNNNNSGTSSTTQATSNVTLERSRTQDFFKYGMHFQGQITKPPVIIAIQGTNKLHGGTKNSKITSETIKNDNLIISKDKI